MPGVGDDANVAIRHCGGRGRYCSRVATAANGLQPAVPLPIHRQADPDIDRRGDAHLDETVRDACGSRTCGARGDIDDRDRRIGGDLERADAGDITRERGFDLGLRGRGAQDRRGDREKRQRQAKRAEGDCHEGVPFFW